MKKYLLPLLDTQTSDRGRRFTPPNETGSRSKGDSAFAPGFAYEVDASQGEVRHAKSKAPSLGQVPLWQWVLMVFAIIFVCIMLIGALWMYQQANRLDPEASDRTAEQN